MNPVTLESWRNFIKYMLFYYILQARIAADLIELRNKSVFAFVMFNALFILIVFLLQLNKDQLHVDWPLGIKTNITYIEETGEVQPNVTTGCVSLHKSNDLPLTGLSWDGTRAWSPGDKETTTLESLNVSTQTLINIRALLNSRPSSWVSAMLTSSVTPLSEK